MKKSHDPDDSHACPDEVHFIPLGVWSPQNPKHKIRRTLSKKINLTGESDGAVAVRTAYNMEMDQQNYWVCCFGVN